MSRLNAAEALAYSASPFPPSSSVWVLTVRSFYEQAGFDTANSFNLAVGMYGVAILGGILSWFFLHRVGRRTLYLVGLALSLVILIVAGIIGALPTTDSTSWALGSMIIILTGVYDATIGPVCYVLVAEIPSSRLRVKTVVLARVAYNLVSIVTNVITPKMLNPTAWDWRGKACFVYAGTVLACLIWCWYRLPDPFGLTYLEMDILFEKKAKARKFRYIFSSLFLSFLSIPLSRLTEIAENSRLTLPRPGTSR